MKDNQEEIKTLEKELESVLHGMTHNISYLALEQLEDEAGEIEEKGAQLKTPTCHHIFRLYDNECGTRAQLINTDEYPRDAYKDDENFTAFQFCPLCGEKL